MYSINQIYTKCLSFFKKKNNLYKSKRIKLNVKNSFTVGYFYGISVITTRYILNNKKIISKVFEII